MSQPHNGANTFIRYHPYFLFTFHDWNFLIKTREIASAKYMKIQAFAIHTLYNEILRKARNLLQIRENIIIESHPFYHLICYWFSWGWSKKSFFLKKNIKMANSKKMSFSKSPILKNFVKLLWIGPWVGLDWLMQRTLM